MNSDGEERIDRGEALAMEPKQAVCSERPTVGPDGSPNWPLLLPASVKVGAVAGCMKSGTTWLMNLLDEHPQIISSGEMHLLSNPSSADPILQLLLQQSGADGSEFTLEAILKHSSDFQTWAKKGHDCWREFWACDPEEHVRQLSRELMRFTFELSASKALARANKGDVQWIFDKSPVHATDFLESFDDTFRAYQKGVIHLVRDPRDVAISRWYHLREMQRWNLESNPDSLLPDDKEACLELLTVGDHPLTREKHFFTEPEFLRRTFREWTVVNESLLTRGKPDLSTPLLIRYEDLRTNRDATLARIGEYLKLAPDIPLGRPSEEPAGRRRPSTFRRGTGGEWRSWFNKEDYALLREECGSLMPEFGYDASAR